MEIKKVKRNGLKKLESRPDGHYSADILLHGHLEGYYADTEVRIGLSTNGRIELNKWNWPQLKDAIDSMFEAVRHERDM